MVVRVGQVEIVFSVQCEALWGVECGGRRRARVAGETLSAGAGDSGDLACDVDFANDVVCGLSKVQIARGVEDYCRREDKRNSACRGLGRRCERRCDKEQKEKCAPEWGVARVMRVNDALRTHEEIAGGILRSNRFAIRFERYV